MTGVEQTGSNIVLRVPTSRQNSASRHKRPNQGGYFTSLSHELTLASEAQEAYALLQVLEFPKTAMTLATLIVVTSTTIVRVPRV
jgi:hypothetical protein